jgi:hypothetical protein
LAFTFERALPISRSVRETDHQRAERTSSMSQASIAIPVDHHTVIHEIQTNPSDEPQSVTLLELVKAVSEVSDSEREILATVTYMLNSGRVRLSGNFRDMPVAKLCG